MSVNPFVAGPPVLPTAMLGRRQELERIATRICNHGQSSAIVGQPLIGKTSLLHYLAAPEMRNELYGVVAGKLIFSFVDCSLLSSSAFTSAHFWQEALQPLKTQIVDPAPKSAIAQQYQICRENSYGTFTLATLFKYLQDIGRRLVLLLDEFDVLLYHPILSSAEFLGGLRSLASNNHGALTLVVAIRQSLSKLNEDAKRFNTGGSPYFNIFREFTLGSFTEQDIDTLLSLADERFSADDKRYLRLLTGGHPYLLQAATQLLWEAHESSEDFPTSDARHGYVYEQLHQSYKHYFTSTWQVWSPFVRQAFTAVALINTKEVILAGYRFEINSFLDGLSELEPELRELEQAGIILQARGAIGGWRVTQRIMLVWLWDELIRALRDENELGKWLQEAEIEGFWRIGQHEHLLQSLKRLGEGANNLMKGYIMAYAMGQAAGDKL